MSSEMNCSNGSNAGTYYDFNTTSFNCKGFNQSIEYIGNLCKTNELLFLSETWFKPHHIASQSISESLSKQGLQIDSRKIFSKSGMEDAPADYVGRPYGGVTMICSNINKEICLEYEEVPCSNNRIVCVNVKTESNEHIKTVIGVYMPYYKNCIQQTDEYLTTLSDLQVLIDEFAPLGPLQIVGDLNAQLPSTADPPKNWYKKPGYNQHSALLNDFINANDLICSDLVSKQKTAYTYFQFETGAFTWIDHIISSINMHNTIISCEILDHAEDNMSDHLPIRCTSRMKLTPSSFTAASSSNKAKPSLNPIICVPNWDNFRIRERYKEHVSAKVQEITLSTPENLSNPTEYVRYALSEVNGCLKKAAQEVSHGSKTKQYKPRHFWCPDLGKLNKQKKFWWSLWVQNGKPHKGQVYEVYKLTKKAFRKYYRNKSCESQNIRFSKLNHLFNRKSPSFWNLVKHKPKHANYKVDIEQMTEHFKNIQQESGELTDDHIAISNIVKTRYAECKAKIMEYKIESDTIRKNIDKLKRKTAPGYDGITTEHLLYANSDVLCNILSNIYTTMMTHNIVPDNLQIGVIIPILKNLHLHRMILTTTGLSPSVQSTQK